MEWKMVRCIHDKRPNACKDCGGSHICEHNRRKYDCVRCNGSRTCIHKKKKKQTVCYVVVQQHADIKESKCIAYIVEDLKYAYIYESMYIASTVK